MNSDQRKSLHIYSRRAYNARDKTSKKHLQKLVLLQSRSRIERLMSIVQIGQRKLMSMLQFLTSILTSTPTTLHLHYDHATTYACESVKDKQLSWQLPMWAAGSGSRVDGGSMMIHEAR